MPESRYALWYARWLTELTPTVLSIVWFIKLKSQLMNVDSKSMAHMPLIRACIITWL